MKGNRRFHRLSWALPLALGLTACVARVEEGVPTPIPAGAARTCESGASNTIELASPDSPDCVLSVQPSELDFPAGGGQGTVTLQNTSTSCTLSVTLGSMLSGECASWSGPGGIGSRQLTLLPGVSQAVTFGADVKAACSDWASIPVTCEGCDGGNIVLTLEASAIWVADAGPLLNGSVQWAFPPVTVGDQVAQEISLSGSWVGAEFEGFSVGLDAGDFSVFSASLPYCIPPGFKQQRALFAPTVSGATTATLVDGVAGYTIQASGTGVLPDAGSGCYLVADRAVVGIDSVPLGTRGQQVVTFTNVGDQPCQIIPGFNYLSGGQPLGYSMSVPGGDNTVNPDSGNLEGPYDVEPGAQWSLQLSFDLAQVNYGPEAAYYGWTGFEDGRSPTLEIYSNDAVTPYRVIYLYATSI
jgi:hypothetical protein